MASGTINVTVSPNTNITGKILWNSTADAQSNASLVTATLSYTKKSGSATYGSGKWWIAINGVSKSFSKSISISGGDSVVIGSFSQTVAHEADGSKSITVSASGGIPGTSFESSQGSASVILEQILRGLARIKMGGAWKTGRVYIKQNGQWKIGQLFVKSGGSWKRGV